MQRRHFLGAAPIALSAALPARAATTPDAPPPTPAGPWAAASAVAPMRASADRLIDISVCTRPFRAQGPRIEAEQRHGKTIVHHYGHGGSGWSLSWGSARVALGLVLAAFEEHDNVTIDHFAKVPELKLVLEAVLGASDAQKKAAQDGGRA